MDKRDADASDSVAHLTPAVWGDPSPYPWRDTSPYPWSDDMANQPNQPQQNDQQAKQQMTSAGIDQQHHDRLLALKPEADRKGVNWSQLLQVLAQLGSSAPALVAILEQILGGGGNP